MGNTRDETTSVELNCVVKEGELWKCTGIVRTQEDEREEYEYSFESARLSSTESIVRRGDTLLYEKKDGKVIEDFSDKHLLIDARAVHWMLTNSKIAITRAKKRSRDAFDDTPTFPDGTGSVMLKFIGHGLDGRKRQVIGYITEGADSHPIFSFTTRNLNDTLTIECDGLVVYNKVGDEVLYHDDCPDVIGMTKELVPYLGTSMHNFFVRHMGKHIWPDEE